MKNTAKNTRPSDKLVLVDLDGTLIDASYVVTDTAIYEAIATLQKQGWQIGLSSDTPYEALLRWKDRFGMNGPIIAEKGAVVESKGKWQFDKETADAFAATRRAIERALRSQDVQVWSGDPVGALLEGQQIGINGDTVVMVNSLRQSSLGLFVRKVDAFGALYIDDAATKDVVGRACQFYPNFSDLSVDLNLNYGIVIVSRRKASKRSGTLQLMNELGCTQIAMIGNSEADFIGRDIALHYAVANSTPEFLLKADIVASSNFTKGVAEIIHGLSVT